MHLEFHSLGFGFDVRDYRDIMRNASKVERFGELLVIQIRDKLLIFDPVTEEMMEAKRV